MNVTKLQYGLISFLLHPSSFILVLLACGCSSLLSGPLPDPTDSVTIRFRNGLQDSAYVQIKDGRRDRALAGSLNNALGGGIGLPSFSSPVGDGVLFGLAPQNEVPVDLFVLKTSRAVDVFLKPNLQEFSDPIASFPQVKVTPGQLLMLSKDGDKFSLK